MKTCPRCNRTYADSENFCEADSSPLISAPAFTQQSASGAIECPVCGGKAEPGEIICNFCGARLEQGQAARPTPPPAASRGASPPTPYPRLTPTGTPSQPSTTARIASPIEPEPGRSIWGVVGYALAAMLALAAGAWFAIHLSASKTEETSVTPSPAGSTAPGVAVANPTVMLANAMPVQVSGPGAASSDRSTDVVRKAFDDNRGSLVDTYNTVLASDPKIADAMLIRLHIASDGSVGTSAVRTSTSPDPSLDAKVVGAMEAWKLSTTKDGDIDVDYPIIFAHSADEATRLEADLHTKVANLSATESPEYAAAPPPQPSPLAAPTAEAAGGAPSPAAAASPAVASVPSPEAAPPGEAPGSEVAKPRRKPRVKTASAAPAPSVFDQVQERLKSNPKLRRVKAYTTGGTVTLFGKVFGEGEKSLAEETVRNISGVTGVVDNITTDEGDWAQQQTRIQQQLANAGLDKVNVKVIGRDAFLSGEVKTDLERSRAVTLAEGAAPVTVRENLIRVAPGSMFGF